MNLISIFSKKNVVINKIIRISLFNVCTHKVMVTEHLHFPPFVCHHQLHRKKEFNFHPADNRHVISCHLKSDESNQMEMN